MVVTTKASQDVEAAKRAAARCINLPNRSFRTVGLWVVLRRFSDRPRDDGGSFLVLLLLDDGSTISGGLGFGGLAGSSI